MSALIAVCMYHFIFTLSVTNWPSSWKHRYIYEQKPSAIKQELLGAFESLTKSEYQRVGFDDYWSQPHRDCHIDRIWRLRVRSIDWLHTLWYESSGHDISISSALTPTHYSIISTISDIGSDQLLKIWSFSVTDWAMLISFAMAGVMIEVNMYR